MMAGNGVSNVVTKRLCIPVLFRILNYQKLKKYLHSSFENGGRGFGFTFNGKMFFLRIDNQFYSEGITLSEFETHNSVKHTDHFPISADYSLEWLNYAPMQGHSSLNNQNKLFYVLNWYF